MSTPNITFEPLTADDFPLMHKWLNDPDVAAWYGLGMENARNPSLDEVTEHYLPRARGETPTHAYTMRLDRQRIGYIQCYRVRDWPDYARAIELDDDAWAIDLFIGEPERRGKGLGAPILVAFVRRHVFSRGGVTTCVISPNPNNFRGIHCYEKAGFKHAKTVLVADAREYEYVMVLQKHG